MFLASFPMVGRHGSSTSATIEFVSWRCIDLSLKPRLPGVSSRVDEERSYANACARHVWLRRCPLPPLSLASLQRQELGERQICQERWKDSEMSEAEFRDIMLEMPDEQMVLTYCACPGGGEDHVPRDLALAAVQVAESAEKWLEITSQIAPNAELLPRPEPQKFQFSRAKVLMLLGQYASTARIGSKKRGKTAGHTS